MKKIAGIIAIAVIAFSCQPETKLETLKEEVKEYRAQIAELKGKIKETQEKIQKLDTAVVKTVSVTANAMKPEVFEHYFTVSGNVEALKKAYISPEAGGQVRSVHVREGQRVKKGDLLVSLNANIIYTQIADAKNSLELLTSVFEKQEKLWNEGIGSEIQYLQAKNNKESIEKKISTLQAQLDMTTVNAPIDGIVDEIMVKPGEMAMPGYEVVRMVNLNGLEVNVDVAERYLPHVKQGDKVEISFPSYGSELKDELTYNVPVSKIGQIVNPANRTFSVQSLIQNKKGMIKPNSVAIVKFRDYVNDEAMVVPSQIVKKDVTGKEFLFVAKKSNQGYIAEKIEVESGNSFNGLTEINKGLSAGDLVIDKGANLVTNNAVIEVVNLPEKKTVVADKKDTVKADSLIKGI